MLISFIKVPSAAPWIRDYVIEPSSDVRIFWEQVSEEDRNGIILGYTISYETECFDEHHPSWHSGEVNVSAPSTMYTFSNLLPGLGYRVRIAAFTSKGISGHYNEKIIFSGKL